MNKKTVVLKITGQLFLNQTTQHLDRTPADALAQQIKQLQNNYTFGIVIGGGAFFRGNQHNNIQLRPTTAHTIGMCATIVNSLMLYDVFQQHNINCTILSAFDGSFAGAPASQVAIDQALKNNQLIIFSGGTGNPYITTDTSAIIRAKQIGASQVWKLTDVDGVYTADPHVDTHATLIKQLTYQEALDKRLRFIDHTALILAQQENVTIRVVNGFEADSLVRTGNDERQGTTIQSSRYNHNDKEFLC